MHFLIYISTPGIQAHYLAHKQNVLPCLLIFDYVVKDFQQNKLRNVNYKSQALQYLKITFFFFLRYLNSLPCASVITSFLSVLVLRLDSRSWAIVFFTQKCNFKLQKFNFFIYCPKKDSVMHFLIYISTPGIPSHYLAHKRNVLPCPFIFDYAVKDCQQNTLRNVNKQSGIIIFKNKAFFSFLGT